MQAATISLLYVLVSTILCHLEILLIGVLLMNVMIPVMDLQVTLSCAWSALTKHAMHASIPNGLGISLGNSSSAFGYISVNE